MFVSYFVFLAGRSLYFSADLSKEATNFLAANREHCCRNMKPFGFLTTTRSWSLEISVSQAQNSFKSLLSCLSSPLSYFNSHLTEIGKSCEIECKLWYILSIVSNVVKNFENVVKTIEIWSKTHRKKRGPLTTVPNVHCTYIIIHL